MNKKYRPLVSTLLIFVGALLFAAARIILVNKYLDAGYGVYRHGTSAPLAFHITLAVCLAAEIVNCLLSSRKVSGFTAPVMNDFSVFTSCISAFMIAATSLLSLYNIVIARASASPVDILMLVFSLPAIVFFFAIVRRSVKPSAPLIFVSFFPIAWSAAYLIKIYFDTTLLITSPAKTLNQLALLAAMVYFLNESRALLGAHNNLLFTASSAVAPVLLIVSSLPALVIPDKLLIGDSDNFLLSAVQLAFALFILGRRYSYLRVNSAPTESNA